MKEQFIKLLQATKRTGIESVVSYLEQAGFFLAPASVSRHLSHEGGLLEHSLNVWKMAEYAHADHGADEAELREQLPKTASSLQPSCTTSAKPTSTRRCRSGARMRTTDGSI